jgi:CBS domain-containing protein
MKKVGEIVRDRPLLYVEDEFSVHEAARFMTDKRIGAVPVLSGERLVGVFSERDLMTRVVVPGRDPRTTLVRDVMTRDLIVASPSDDVEACEVKMAAAGCRHLPVVQGDRLLGFLSLRDLMRSDLDEKCEELAMMTYYVQYVPPDVEQRIFHERVE